MLHTMRFNLLKKNARIVRILTQKLKNGFGKGVLQWKKSCSKDYIQ